MSTDRTIYRDVQHLPGFRVNRDGDLYGPNGNRVHEETRAGRYQMLDYFVVETQSNGVTLATRFEPVWYVLWRTWYPETVAILPRNGNSGYLSPANIIQIKSWSRFPKSIRPRMDYEMILFVWSEYAQKDVPVSKLAEKCGVTCVQDDPMLLLGLIEDIVVSGVRR